MVNDAARRMDRMPRFERRVLVGGLLVAVPGWVVVAALVLRSPDIGWLWALVAVTAAATVSLGIWHRRRIAHPIYTLSSLLEALREGDYSLRGASNSALGDVVYDVNALASELKRERLRFQESTHLLRKTLAAMDSAVLVFDAEQRLRLLNPVARRLLGAGQQHLFGCTGSELGIAALLAGPASSVLTHTFPGRSGRFEVRHAPLWRQGRSGELLVINDVDRVLRDEERQAWQRLLRVLGHEINNSLAPIQSITETLATLLASDPMPNDWRNDFESGLGIIGHRSAALARFVAGYRRLARLPPPQPQRIDLAVLVPKVAKLEQRLPISVDPGGPVIVSADPDQLEQALINLLRNAAEAALASDPQVCARWRSDGASQGIIEVEDNGPGPPPSENLFVPFFTTKPAGTGIGLALARQIAEAHGGGVTLTARTDGTGALARMWVPLA